MKLLAKCLPALLLLGAVTVSAAPGDSPAAEKSSPPPPAKVLTVEEMQTKSVEIEAQLETDTQHVLHLKEVAKKKKDVIKLNCVNDRLVEIKAQRNIADQANVSLQAALTRDGTERQQLFSQLAGIGESVKALREQANSCIGEPELFKQESGVEVTHPEIVDDPTNGINVEPGIEPPGYASPYV